MTRAGFGRSERMAKRRQWDARAIAGKGKHECPFFRIGAQRGGLRRFREKCLKLFADTEKIRYSVTSTFSISKPMRDKSTCFAFSIRPVGFRRPFLAILAITVLASSAVPESHAGISASDENRLIALGFDRTYAGLVKGTSSSRVSPNASFSDTQVSVIHREVVPPPSGNTIDSPARAGQFSILWRVSASKRKAVITGKYFGTVFNSTLGFNVIRSGTRKLEISKKGKNQGRFIGKFTETIRETDETTGVVYSTSSVKGTLR
jgi:hypothetical protein